MLATACNVPPPNNPGTFWLTIWIVQKVWQVRKIDWFYRQCSSIGDDSRRGVERLILASQVSQVNIKLLDYPLPFSLGMVMSKSTLLF
jgi:hypothetical protein